ncbi:ferritin-like domain-containing protein [Streptomyces sp. NPDC057545]|uniref:ferritin-like domain-containing protein n=1 Tax=Streptomyces sp. NPDC057545 TaxID=3346164 RepID=UPI00368356DB
MQIGLRSAGWPGRCFRQPGQRDARTTSPCRTRGAAGRGRPCGTGPGSGRRADGRPGGPPCRAPRTAPVPRSAGTRLYSCRRLNKTLAETQMLHALYKKHHWLVRGAAFHQLHLLLDTHANRQPELVDLLAEQVQSRSRAAGARGGERRLDGQGGRTRTRCTASS